MKNAQREPIRKVVNMVKTIKAFLLKLSLNVLVLNKGISLLLTIGYRKLTPLITIPIDNIEFLQGKLFQTY